jgi:hypothetical protein
MAEFVVKVPKALSKEAKKIEHDVNEYVCMEEKKKRLSLFLEDAMQGADSSVRMK